MHSVVHKHTGRDLRDRQGCGLGTTGRRPEDDGDGDGEPEVPPDNTGEKHARTDPASGLYPALCWRFNLWAKTGPNRHPALLPCHCGHFRDRGYPGGAARFFLGRNSSPSTSPSRSDDEDRASIWFPYLGGEA